MRPLVVFDNLEFHSRPPGDFLLLVGEYALVILALALGVPICMIFWILDGC